MHDVSHCKKMYIGRIKFKRSKALRIILDNHHVRVVKLLVIDSSQHKNIKDKSIFLVLFWSE